MNRIHISTGTRDDLLALQDYHYNSAEPATFALVLRAHWHGTLAGVIVVSHPTLNADWRGAAFGNTLFGHDKSLLARRTNKHVRTISRVIVDPRFRGLGIATTLVRHYLAAPLTSCTEAVSVLNAFIPLFERAGMRRIDLAPAIRDRMLLLHLADLHMTPLDLATVAASNGLSSLNQRVLQSLLPALSRWGQSHRGTRRLTCPTTLARHAAKSLLLPRVVFVAGSVTVLRKPTADATCHLVPFQ